MPCGLALNELTTNALKHGRDADERCAIAVRVDRSSVGFAMEVRDSGPGFEEDKLGSATLGMQLLRTLRRQLRATIAVSSAGGARVTFSVPDEASSAAQQALDGA